MDLDRLAKLLGMVGSVHDGEALTAARMADKLVRDAGMTWSQVVASTATVAWIEPVTVAGACDACLRSVVAWSYREAGFLMQLPRFQSPSPKQLDWLADLLDRARSAVGAAAPTATPAWAEPPSPPPPAPEPPPRQRKARASRRSRTRSKPEGSAHAGA